MQPNPPRVTLDGLDEEEIRKIVRLALLVVVDLALDKPWHAYDRIMVAKLEAEQSIAFWSLLDSAQRSWLKEIHQHDNRSRQDVSHHPEGGGVDGATN